MKGFIIKTGIDLGSKAIKVVVSAENTDSGVSEILGATKELSSGIVHGQIVSVKDVESCVRKAIQKTESALKLKIDKVSVGVSSVDIKSTLVKIRSTVAKASNEISELDLEKSKLEALKTLNVDSPLELLHTHISSIMVDGKRVKGNVIGSIGHNIEINYLLTTIPKKSLENILAVFEKLKLEVVEINANCFSAGNVLLDKTDKLFGSGVLDIGCDNTTFTIYDNGYPISARTYPVGGNTFNKDLSIGLGIKMEEAESIKRNLKPSDSKKLFQIIEARMEDFVDLVKRDLERSHSGAQLANGIILTGGSANLYDIQEKMRYKLKLPVTDGKSIISKQSHNVLKDASWINAFALTSVDFSQDSLMQSFTKNTFKSIKRFFQKIAP